jgi:hypothetical protein
MKYKLTIIKYEANENYEAELAKFKEALNYNRYRNEPSQDEPKIEVANRSLEVFLTDEEYKKVKAEVIKIFE